MARSNKLAKLAAVKARSADFQGRQPDVARRGSSVKRMQEPIVQRSGAEGDGQEERARQPDRQVDPPR